MKIIETVYDLFLKFYCLRVSVNVAFDRLTSNNGVFGVPSGRWTTSSGVGRRLFREVCFLSVLGTFCWPGVLPFFLVEREWLHDKGCSVWLQCARGKGLTLRPIWYSANPAVNDILPYMCWYVHNLAADDFWISDILWRQSVVILQDKYAEYVIRPGNERSFFKLYHLQPFITGTLLCVHGCCCRLM